MWADILIGQMLDLVRQRKFEAVAEAQLDESNWKIGYCITNRVQLVRMTETIERRIRTTLREIDGHREFALRAEKAVAQLGARRPALIEDRTNPSQSDVEPDKLVTDETSPGLVPAQDEGLESEEAASETDSSVEDDAVNETAEGAEEGAEAEGEESGAAADDTETDDEEVALRPRRTR
jgi:hypothetical protein